MLGMVGALLLIWIAFHLLSGGLFLTPRNLWNLSVQSSPVADHGDRHGAGHRDPQHRSVGRLDARLHRHGHGRDPGAICCRSFSASNIRRPGSSRSQPGSCSASLLGALQGFVIAYLGIPAFIVTLGGLLVWRGAAWWVTSGQTVAPLDSTFRLMGGGPEGSIGATWSWVVGLIACAAVVLLLAHGRARRKNFDFPLRPMAAEVFLGGIACALILAAVAIVNAYPWPAGIVRRYAEANHIALPEGGLFIAHGIADSGADRDRRRRGDDLPRDAHALRPLRLCHRRQSGGGRARRRQHALGDHEDFHADGASCRHRRRDFDRAPQCGHELGRHARRIAGHRRRRHRRHVAGRRRRHRRRRDARRRADAVAAIGHGAARRRYAAAEYRRRRRPGARGLARHRLSPAHG